MANAGSPWLGGSVPTVLVLAAAGAMSWQANAASPIIGISCGGGFFVTAPQNKVYWINEVEKTKVEVLDGSSKLVALAECGAGVVSIVSGKQPDDLYRVMFSSDCRNVSQSTRTTREIYRTKDRVTRLSVDQAGVSISFASGKRINSSACTRLAPPARADLAPASQP